MLPLVLPPQIGQPDPLLRGIAELTLFAAAYIAKTLRLLQFRFDDCLNQKLKKSQAFVTHGLVSKQ
ncbi:MAG: hypothetical protein KME10_26170 [Plectolyngbya sp. WJT66-NPBG17]|nr:hypothetical protein [Plectolyngbya sp. WJT66-NPBG17]